MERKNKEYMKASESAPMPTKQKDDAGVNNQTTNVPRTRFPWAVIAVIAVILIVITLVMLSSS